MLQFTGRRKPILISGAGKVVDGILRQRPCFILFPPFNAKRGAPHGFHADYRASYRREAAEDGWNQMQAWFKQYGALS